MARHNKKRNSGLLYEFLVRTISRAIVENDESKARISKNILGKYFKVGTELHKEYRLINALVNVSVGSEAVAHAVLEEARRAAQQMNGSALKEEKSNLIREINYSLGQNEVYGESVENYKDYASAASLIKYWRNEKSLDISTVVKFEKVLIENLSRPTGEDADLSPDPNVDNLVVKVATEKLQSKYNEKFTNEQTSLLRAYAVLQDFEKCADIISEACNKAKSLLEIETEAADDFLSEKIKRAMKNIDELSVRDVCDETITKALQVMDLKIELEAN